MADLTTHRSRARRLTLKALSAGAFALASSCIAQNASKAKRIGLLLAADGDPPPAVQDALAKRGWVRDRTLFWVKRVGKSEAELRMMARELVATNVDVIFTFSTPATLAAKAATTTIPILFVVGADPVESGIVASLARPGGNATGVAHGLYDEKLLQYLKDAVPKLSRVLYPTAVLSPAARAAASALRIMIDGFPVPTADAFDDFFAAVAKQKPDGVVFPNVAWMAWQSRRLGKWALDARVPAIAIWGDFVEAGGLLSAGPVIDLERRIEVIDALLRGASAADIPVEMPRRFELVVNRTTAKTLGLTISRALLAHAKLID